MATRTCNRRAGARARCKVLPAFAVRYARLNPVALLVMVMLALGTTAPEASLTVPVMVPVGVCAWTGAMVQSRVLATNNVDASLNMALKVSLKERLKHLMAG